MEPKVTLSDVEALIAATFSEHRPVLFNDDANDEQGFAYYVWRNQFAALVFMGYPRAISGQVAHVYRIASSSQSNEQVAIFFAWTGYIDGNQSSTCACGGPFRNVAETLEFLYGDRAPHDYETTGDFPEKDALQEWIHQHSRRRKRQTRS